MTDTKNPRGAAVDLAFQAPDLLIERLLRCDKCAADVLHRARLSPAAGPVWRCSQCGETHDTPATFGDPVSTKDTLAFDAWAICLTSREWIGAILDRMKHDFGASDEINKKLILEIATKNPALREALCRLTATEGMFREAVRLHLEAETALAAAQEEVRQFQEQLASLNRGNGTLIDLLAAAEEEIITLKVPAPEPTAVDPLPDAPKCAEGMPDWVHHWIEYAADLRRIGEERGREVDGLRGDVEQAESAYEKQRARAESLKEKLGRVNGNVMRVCDSLGVGDLWDAEEVVESLKAQLAARPAPAPQSPDPWEVRRKDPKWMAWLRAVLKHEPADEPVKHLFDTDPARVADQATIAGLREDGANLLKEADSEHSLRLSTEKEAQEFSTKLSNDLAASRATIAERDAEIERLKREACIYCDEETGTHEPDCNVVVRDTLTAAIAAKEEAEAKLRDLRIELESATTRDEMANQMREEAEAKLREVEKERADLEQERDYLNSEAIEAVEEREKAETERDGERTAREHVEQRCADLMRERDEARAVASGQVSLNLELEERVRVLEGQRTVLMVAAEAARSALDNLMGDSDLDDDQSAEYAAMLLLSSALAFASASTPPEDPPAEEPEAEWVGSRHDGLLAQTLTQEQTALLTEPASPQGVTAGEVVGHYRSVEGDQAGWYCPSKSRTAVCPETWGIEVPDCPHCKAVSPRKAGYFYLDPAAPTPEEPAESAEEEN